MPRVSGVDTTVTIDDSGGTARDLSEDITGMPGLNLPRGVQDITAIGDEAMRRQLLRADGTIDVNFVVNTDANRSQAVLVVNRTGVRTVQVVLPGAGAGRTLSMEMIITNVNLTVADDGSMTGTATLQLADGTVPAWT